MTASEIRAQARKSLAGKWGKSALITLIYAILVIVLEFVLSFIPVIGPIIITVITVPLSFGMISTFMKLKNGEDPTYTQFFSDGFNSFGRVWKAILWTLVKMIVPILLILGSYIIIFVGIGFSAYDFVNANSISELSSTGSIITLIGFVLLIIAGIYAAIKYFLYVLIYFILNDKPEIQPKDAVEESARLMKGHRGQYFWLILTFIGWAILSSIVFGIGYLWLLPYIIISQVFFYDYLSGNKQNEFELNNNDETENV